MNQNKIVNKWLAVAALVLSCLVYFVTSADDVSFWDVGEFIACSYTLSVMHPPGAPLYIILGRIFTFLPFGNVATQVNFMSVLSSALTVMFLYLIIVRIIIQFRGQPKTTLERMMTYGSAFIGSLSFAFTESFWFNAVEAEVYAISMLFTALVIWLVLVWGDNSEEMKNLSFLVLIVYLFGLATGVHLLNILTFPFVLLIVHFRNNESAKKVVWVAFFQALIPISLYILIFNYNPASMDYNQFISHQETAGSFLLYSGLITLAISLYYLYAKDKLAFKLWMCIPLLVIVGYSTYLIIYIRSGLNPPIDENDPEVWSRMADYLARKQYGEQSLLLTLFQRKADLWTYQIKKMFIRYFAWQFVGKGTTLGPQDGYIVENWSLRGLFMLPFITGVVGAYYHFRRDWKHALSILVLFIATGIAIIFYLNQDDPQPRERDYVYVGSFFAFAIWIGVGVYAILDMIQEFLENKKKYLIPIVCTCLGVIAIALPINMYFFNFDEHDRRGNYVPYDYSYNILETCEPDAIIFTNGDNDTFPLWYLQFVKNIRPDVRIVNLSLLNTDWYIKQLRDEEPRVPISFTDEQLKSLGLFSWPEPKDFSLPVSANVYADFREELQNRGEWQEGTPEPEHIRFRVPPTIGNPKRALRVQDLAILNILSSNKWKRPIYFAVTVADVNKVGLQRYLRMDGMAFKLVPYSNLRISASLLQKNLMEKFKYRNLSNPDVYMDEKTKGLLTNYRSAFIRLADHYRVEDEKSRALDTLDKMEELMPEEIVPFPDPRLPVHIASMYEVLGRPDEFEQRIRKILERNPSLIDAYAALLSYYQRTENYEMAIDLMNDWLARNPTDENARRLLADLEKKLAAKDSSNQNGSNGE